MNEGYYASIGYTTKEIREAIITVVNRNGDRKILENLSPVFADYTLDKSQLIKAVKQSLDPCQLEEAARMVVNSSIYYCDGRWFFYEDAQESYDYE